MKKNLFILVIVAALSNAAQAEAAAYSAANVLGQANFTTATAATTQNGLSGPSGTAYDSTNNRLFVSDRANNRILVYDLTAISNGENAVNVLGQADFTSSAAATAQNRLSAPRGLSYDATNQRLYVADNGNNRVLMFDVASITNGENAALVLGQANFTSNTAATSASGMKGPKSVLYDATNDRLFVGEHTNARVLVFNNASTLSNGASASNVLGQPDFTTATPGMTQSKLEQSTNALAFDATNNRLFVADQGNSRVMVFDVASITNGENAINVLGQADFTSSAINTTQNGLDSPTGLAYDAAANYLFVADALNDRIMIFDVSSITNGENAVNVLGQADFTSLGAATTQTGLAISGGNDVLPTYDSSVNRLFVPDHDNNRVIIYNFVRITDTSYPNGTLNSAYSQSITSTGSQGTVSYAVASGALPTGLSISSGSITGTPSAAGDYTFTLRATDAFDTGNFLYTSGNYTITIAGASGGPPAPLQFAEQQRRLAVRLAPAPPDVSRIVSSSCTPARCPIELQFTYAPLALHRGRVTRFVFYDDQNRSIASLIAIPSFTGDYQLIIPVNGANSAIFGRLCATVGTQESCTPVQGFTDIVLAPDAVQWNDELLDAAREEYRLSFRWVKLPVNYSVGKTGAKIAVYEENNGELKFIIERAVDLTPRLQVLVPVIHAGNYIIRVTPYNAEGKPGAAIEQRITVPLLRVTEKIAPEMRVGNGQTIEEILTRLKELLQALLVELGR